MRYLPMHLRPPGVCPVCERPLVFTGKRWQDPGQHRGKGRPHVCPEERIACGAMMPQARMRCARLPGHTTEHRSSYALENARRTRTGIGL